MPIPTSSSQPLRSSPPSHFLESMAECEDNDRKTSIIMVDARDDRIVSFFRAHSGEQVAGLPCMLHCLCTMTNTAGCLRYKLKQ